jgi:hypothetical protein
MPSEKKVLNPIPKVYKNNFEDIAMFFFIRGQQRILPTIALSQAIKGFRDETGITEYEWEDCCIRATFSRLSKEVIDMKYNKVIDTKHENPINKRECDYPDV